MNIQANLTQRELTSLLAQRNISRDNRYEIPFEDTNGDVTFTLYSSNEKIAQDIRTDMELFISNIIMGILDGTKTGYEVEYMLSLKTEDSNKANFLTVKFQEFQKVAVYLKFYFNNKHDIISIGYINKNGDETSGTVEDSIEQMELNPLAGIYDILNHFKTKVLKIRVKKRKPSSDTAVVVLSRSHKMRMNKNESKAVQEKINKIISICDEKGVRNYVSSEKASNGTRKISINFYSNSRSQELKTTILNASDSQSRYLYFYVYEDTLELTDFKFIVGDSTKTSYSDKIQSAIEKEFKDKEAEQLAKLSLIDQLQWIIDNKL